MGGSICFLPVGAPFDNLAARWHVTSKVFVDSSASVFRWAAGGGNAGAAVACRLPPGAGAGAATTGLAAALKRAPLRSELSPLEPGKAQNSNLALRHAPTLVARILYSCCSLANMIEGNVLAAGGLQTQAEKDPKRRAKCIYLRAVREFDVVGLKLETPDCFGRHPRPGISFR